MRKIPILFILPLFFTYSSRAQLLQGEFNYGGAGLENGSSLIQSSDSGYAIVGTTFSYLYFGNANSIYVIKTDKYGNIQWTNSFGCAGGAIINYGFGILQNRCVDDSLAFSIVGQSDSIGASASVIVATFGGAGNLLWTANWTIGDDQGNSFLQTKDCGFVIGETFGEFCMMKLNPSHNAISWLKGGGQPTGNTSICNSVIATKDGGFLGAGFCNQARSIYDKVYVVKLDSSGNLVWNRVIGGTKSDEVYCVKECKDGGYILTGTTKSFNDTLNGDIYVVKLDSLGNLQWTKTIGGIGEEGGNSIILDRNGGYVIAGYTTSWGMGMKDVYVVKIDSLGNIIWAKTIGGPQDDIGESIVQTYDGGYAIAGTTYSYTHGTGDCDVYLIKLDSLGNSCNTISAGGDTGSGGTISNGINMGTTTAVPIHAGGTIHGGLQDTRCTKIITDDNFKTSPEQVRIFPNPTTGIFTIQLSGGDAKFCVSTIEVYNVLGEKIYSETLRGTQGDKVINLIGQPNGVYFYRALQENGELAGSGKFVIQR